MSNLTRNTIQARGVDYEVRELSGKDMAQVRRLAADSQTYKMEQYVAMTCCLAPKLTQKEVDELPSLVITAISDEAFRLSKLAEPGKRLTPEQIFEHRLAALLGRSIDDLLATLSAAELRRWRLYWEEEPWGAHRDNLHTAMIISQLLRPNLKDGAAPPLKTFMLMHPEDREAEAAQDFVISLDVLARKQARDERKAKAAKAKRNV